MDAFIRQSHRIQAMEAEGRDPGREMRRHVRAVAAEREVTGHGMALAEAVRGNGAGLQGVGQEVAARERGQRVRTWLRGREGGANPAGDSRGSEARRLVQAEAARKTLARHVAGLDEALRRNGVALTVVGEAVGAHLRGLRSEAGTARHQVETVARKPSSSPSPGM
mgnify:CR=1 FL=1